MSGRLAGATVTSADNAAVKAARRLARRHGSARRDESFLVEGVQTVAEAVGHLERLFVAAAPGGVLAPDVAAVVERAAGAGAAVVAVTPQVLAGLTATVTPRGGDGNGLVGVARLEPFDLGAVLAGAAQGAGLVVVLHQARDPGNAGAVVRSADAAGADAVVLTRGSVDPRNPKAVRASAGSLFHLPVVTDVAFSTLVAACREAGLRLVGAAVDADLAYTDADLGRPSALVFGNEARGLEPAVRAACDLVVAVPQRRSPRPGFRATAESLNLAATAAVVTYEVVRQRGDARLGRAAGAATR